MNINFSWYFTDQIDIPESSAYLDRLIDDKLSRAFSFLSLVEINFKRGSTGDNDNKKWAQIYSDGSNYAYK